MVGLATSFGEGASPNTVAQSHFPQSTTKYHLSRSTISNSIPPKPSTVTFAFLVLSHKGKLSGERGTSQRLLAGPHAMAGNDGTRQLQTLELRIPNSAPRSA